MPIVRMIVTTVPPGMGSQAERNWKEKCATLMIKQPGCPWRLSDAGPSLGVRGSVRHRPASETLHNRRAHISTLRNDFPRQELSSRDKMWGLK
jgi:hypothetical protein